MEKKQSLIMTIGAVVLIIVVVLVSGLINENMDTAQENTSKKDNSALDAAQTVASALCPDYGWDYWRNRCRSNVPVHCMK